jgi:outer membrane protein OmpA-like peptidoglycan-associated protein
MKNNLFILLFFVCFNSSLQAQEIYFLSGKNFTTYNFRNSSGNSNPNLKNGNGTFYEVGCTNNLKNSRFSYSFAIALNEYNNTGSTTVNHYQWDTQYLGVQTKLYYSFFTGKKYDLLPSIGCNPSSIIKGSQQLNGMFYDLTKEKEFKGLFITPSIGLLFKYSFANFSYISLGYNYIKSYNLSNSTNQKLGFTTSQIQFGLHFAIPSKKDPQDSSFVINALQEPIKQTKEEPIIYSISKNIENKVPSEGLAENNNESLQTNNNNLKIQDPIEKNIESHNTDPIKSQELVKPDYSTCKNCAFNFSSKGFAILQANDDLINYATEYLLKNPTNKLIVNGFASSDGSQQANYTLSLKRALIAKEYLIIKGVAANRIEAIGKGSVNPISTNSTIEGRLKNKRVEIEFK